MFDIAFEDVNLHKNKTSIVKYFIGLGKHQEKLTVGIAHQADDIKMTSYRRRCDVMMLNRRQYDIIMMLCARWERSS